MSTTYLSDSRSAAVTSCDHSAYFTDAYRPASSDSLDAMRMAGVDALARQKVLDADALLEFDGIWQVMRDASPFVMARTLWELGWLHSDDDVLTADVIAEQSCSVGKYRPLISQWLGVLSDHGIVHRLHDQPSTYVGRRLDIVDANRRINRAEAAVDVTAPYRGFIDYFLSCVHQQTNLFRGAVNPQKLLFPMGSWHVVDGLYRTNPASALQNKVVASLIHQALLAGMKLKRPLRILEVGAGTGATSQAVLNHLPLGDIEYRFTDISRFFLKRAARNFASEPRLRFDLLDIDRPAKEQGFQTDAFDIVVAANVLHTARRVDVALGHLKELLSPSGVVIAIETTSNTALQMITFGHFDGVCHFQDMRRYSNLPFLSCSDWLTELLAAGFAEVTSVPSQDDAASTWAQHIVIGQSGKV